MLLGVPNASIADVRCTPAELVYGMAHRLPGKFADLSNSLMNADQSFYTRRITNRWIQLNFRQFNRNQLMFFVSLPNHIVCTFSQVVSNTPSPLATYEGLYDIVYHVSMYHTFDKDEIKDRTSIERLSAVN